MGYRNTRREKARRRERHHWAISVVRDPDVLGGSPVFPGTRTSVEHIGSLLLKGAVDEVRKDYPHLSECDLEGARRWALRTGPGRERRLARLLHTQYRQNQIVVEMEFNLPLRAMTSKVLNSNGVRPLETRKFYR